VAVGGEAVVGGRDRDGLGWAIVRILLPPYTQTLMVLLGFTRQFEDVGGSGPSIVVVAASSDGWGRSVGLDGELGRCRC
jgi:hypothetical protein